MTIDLDAIKARLAAACPGPWTGMTVKRFIDGDCLAIVREHPEGSHKSEKGTTLTIAATILPQYGDNDTAAMLLHSRADMDALVAEVERLRAQRALDNEEAARLYDFARDKGSALERAAVVAWLRRKATDDFCALRVKEACDAEKSADDIERGAHRREEEG